MSAKPDLRIVLCSPRGFCAGVVRAIDTVERALTIYGAPVYVRHEIVHNRYVVDSLKTKGAIFVEELAEIPDNTNAPVVFSAHGVPKSVPANARARNFFSLDATCPLVTKVHREAAIHFKRGREILLIGHSHHPEVVGTLGQLPPGAVTLIETAEDAKTFTPKDPNNLAFVTSGQVASSEKKLRARASAGTDFGTPWAENTTGALVLSGISASSSTKIAPLVLRLSTT